MFIMKQKTILLILVVIILLALIGANVYDFYKAATFKTAIHPGEKN